MLLQNYIEKYYEKLQLGVIIPINKPLDWTSFDAIRKIQLIIKKINRDTEYHNDNQINLYHKKFVKENKNSKKIKIGHTGTLDPRATGLLIVCTGKKTKEIVQFQSLDKVYEGCITLGKTTPSFDIETPFITSKKFNHITLNDILDATKKLTGIIQQTPPIYSAIKHKGKRLYEFARSNKHVDISPRKIEVKSFTVKKLELPNIYFEIVCGKGTYIRSIANDLGLLLDTGAYLSQLILTQIGSYNLKNAININ